MNKLIFPHLIFFYFLIITGCGIGGAGRDPLSKINEAKNYKASMSSFVEEIVFNTAETSKPKQHFKDILRTFPKEVQRVKGDLLNINGTPFRARYFMNTFVFLRNESEIIKEKFPDVFYMHPVRLGIGYLSNHEIVMIVNKSRSTTGLYFIALFETSGKSLYKKVLSGGEVWDINASSDYIDIIGCNQTRRIKFKKEA